MPTSSLETDGTRGFLPIHFTFPYTVPPSSSKAITLSRILKTLSFCKILSPQLLSLVALLGDLVTAGGLLGDLVTAGGLLGDLVTAGGLLGDLVTAGGLLGDLVTAGTLLSDNLSSPTKTPQSFSHLKNCKFLKKPSLVPWYLCS